MKTDKDSSQVNIGDVEGGIHDSTFAGRDVIKNIRDFFISGGSELHLALLQ
jgi:hypothetical protein